MGNILAVKLGPEVDLPENPYQETEISGYTAVLSLIRIEKRVQTTVFWGHSLVCMNDVGSLSSQQLVSRFLAQWTNIPKTWAQLDFVPPPSMAYRLYLTPTSPQNPPVATQCITLLNHGFEPFGGYWMEFKGNYNLHINLFKDPDAYTLYPPSDPTDPIQ